jgi:hypothetical protein
MRLSEFLPQPIRNIYQNYQLLKDPAITPENRVDSIQKISKDCFRLLLILPIALYSKAVCQAAREAKSPLWVPAICLIPCIAISPAANMLYFAGLSACISVDALVHAVAAKSISLVGLSIAFGLVAAFC